MNILLIVDTAAIVAAYPQPSQNLECPTSVAPEMLLMVVTGATSALDEQGGRQIVVRDGDRARIFVTSGSANFGDAVLALGFARDNQPWPGLAPCEELRERVVPHSAHEPLPAGHEAWNFWFYEVRMKPEGPASYSVYFTLFTRDPETDRPVLFGYFAWTVMLTFVEQKDES